jgi:adenosylcobinamide-phosphate synthase
MTFLSILAALLLEQLRPLRQDNRLYFGFDRYTQALERHFNAGAYRDGAIAWALAVAPLLFAVVAVQHLLASAGTSFAWLWNVAVLYLTIGFRQFSHFFTEIQHALREGDLVAARAGLGKWCGQSAAEFSACEVARVAIEQGLLASHRHVFGPLAWFVALGPAGAVLYRASARLADQWGGPAAAEPPAFGRFASRLFHWLDWVPVRVTAASFAIVGNFEDALYCWRTQAAAWGTRAQGILLAAGGGALGVRLGDTLHQPAGLLFRPEMGLGEDPDADALPSAAGLIWRTLVLWMFLIFLVSLAHALG